MVFNHSNEGLRKNIFIIVRLEAKASQIINIKIDKLKMEIRDPMDEIIFQFRKLSG